MSLFQSNLRKQIRNLPKILNFVRIIHYYSKLFTGVLRRPRPSARGSRSARPPGTSTGRFGAAWSPSCDGAGGRRGGELLHHVEVRQNSFSLVRVASSDTMTFLQIE